MNQEDRNQILELISKNCYYYDFHQPEKRRKLFTDDLHTEMWNQGKLIRETNTAEEFLEIQNKRREWLTEQGIQPRHFNTDVILEEKSDGMVIGTAMHFTAWKRKDEEKPEMVHMGVFDFAFTKIGKKWKVSKRIYKVD